MYNIIKDDPNIEKGEYVIILEKENEIATKKLDLKPIIEHFLTFLQKWYPQLITAMPEKSKFIDDVVDYLDGFTNVYSVLRSDDLDTALSNLLKKLNIQ